MHPRNAIQFAALLLLFTVAGCQSFKPSPVPAAKAPQEPPFAKQIDAMLARDAQQPPAKHGIVFVGSSTFTNWKSVGRDMAPLPVSNRGFGGAQTTDILYWMDKIVLPLEPKIIVYYCGENDLAIHKEAPPEIAVRGFQQFVARVHAARPETRILYVSMKPSPKRLALWPRFEEANNQIRRWCRWRPRVEFIDLRPLMLDEAGQPRADFYTKDPLHINESGYAAWTAELKPRLTELWEAEATR